MSQSVAASRFLNMDWVRYVLTTSVVIAHYNILTGHSFYYPVRGTAAVNIFFGLSGFLVYASYERAENLKQYFSHRARRILPPYVFIVLVCAIGLSAVSTLPLQQYFTDMAFWKYLCANLAFLNFLQPELPGVFDHLEISAVNGSLWTLKVEWMLYLTMPIFCYVVRRFRWSFDYAIAGILLLSVVYTQLMELLFERTGNNLYRILSHQFVGQMTYFYSGVFVFRHLSWIDTHKFQVFVLCCVALLSAQWIGDNMPPSHGLSMLLNLVWPFSIVCIALVISICRPVFASAIQKLGNCSYEIYLFHFPLCQLVALWALPAKYGSGVALCLTLSVLFAVSLLYNKGYPFVKRLVAKGNPLS